METTTTLEKQRARTLAEEYRSKGYQVIEEPSQEQLPDFLSNYQPDLLIQKGHEGVVVEVKSRSSLAKDSKIRDLARLCISQKTSESCKAVSPTMSGPSSKPSAANQKMVHVSLQSNLRMGTGSD